MVISYLLRTGSSLNQGGSRVDLVVQSLKPSTMSFPTPSDELSSWKEIAAYLRVGVRTAQGWERDRGLPVRRLPGSRGIVSARIEEIERWRSNSNTPSASPPTRSWWHPYQRLAIVAPLALIATVALWLRHDPVIRRASLERQALVAFDGGGRELWRASFPGELRALSDSPSERRIWIGDLDGDRAAALLFGRTDMNPTGQHTLICYSLTGVERWRFVPAATLRTAHGAYAPPYGIHAVAVAKVDGKNVIAVSSYHYPYAAARITLLDAHGQVLGSYSHFGHLSQMVFADLQGNGHPLLYLGGISNRDHAAVLISLDPAAMRGDTQGPNGPFLNIPKLPERVRILFPRSQMNERFELYNAVIVIDVLGKSLLVHVLERFGSSPGFPTLMYHLDPSLRLTAVAPSDAFTVDQARHYQERRLPLAGGAELDRLAKAYRQARP